MYAYLYFPDGSTVTALETTDGWPIIPSRDDLVQKEGVVYRVKSVSWDYDSGRVDVQCDVKTRREEKLHYDERTMFLVTSSICSGFVEAGFTKSGALDKTNKIINELQNSGILFRERAKD